MRKLLVLPLLIISLIFLLTACQGDSQNEFDVAFDKLSDSMLTEVHNDYTLPYLSDSIFSVVYRIDGTVVVDNLIVYDNPQVDIVIMIDAYISNGEVNRKYEFIITQLKSEYSDEELFFNGIFEVVENQVPEVLMSHLTLPVYDDDSVLLSYSSNCAEIEHGRIIYPFPTEDTACVLRVSVTVDDVTKSNEMVLVFSGIDNLPKIPEIYITTEGNAEIESNKEYISGSLTVISDGSFDNADITNESLSIRLRGNSTLWMPKLSYKIKFDEKTKLLNDNSEKDWVLLANFADQTLIRTALAYNMASELNMSFAPSVTFVDVYVNGVYQGNYMLTDQIEVTNDRVDIEENVPDIDTGYLIEFDKGLWRSDEEIASSNYFVVDGIPFVLKSPQIEDDHYSAAQKQYIKEYVEDVLNALEAGDDYSALIDEASFIDWFIVSEVFKNVDSGYSSVYFYKDKGGKLEMGPVWDFDLSTGNPGHLGDDLRGPEGWYTNRWDKNLFFAYLMNYPSFQENLKARWNEVYDETILGLLDDVYYYSDSITDSRYQNFELWDIIGTNEEWYTAPEILELQTYDEQVWFLYDYLQVRIMWLDKEINKF